MAYGDGSEVIVMVWALAPDCLSNYQMVQFILGDNYECKKFLEENLF